MTVTIAARGPHVIISNAGYGLFGTPEELTDKQVDHIVSSECRKRFPIRCVLLGYYRSLVSPPGRDGGLDIIAYPDPLGTRAPRIKVQVKRNAQRVDEDGLRSFLALVNEDDVGLFVNIGGFTRAAEEAARKQERRKITLIDLTRLVELWIEFYAKLDDIARDRLPLTPIHFLTAKT
jgi:restriction system protein